MERIVIDGSGRLISNKEKAAGMVGSMSYGRLLRLLADNEAQHGERITRVIFDGGGLTICYEIEDKAPVETTPSPA